MFKRWYHYKVDGSTFTGDQLYPGGMLIRGPGEENVTSAQDLVSEYAPGTHVPVWYLPHEPETAFLKPIRRVDNGAFSLCGGLLAAGGIGLLLPFVIPSRTARFACAAILFLFAQALTWLMWSAFLAAPREQLSGSPRLLQWLLVAYVLMCWLALAAQAPPALRKLREATFASLGFGTLAMSLSLFVLVPLMTLAPGRPWMHILPWVGIVTAILSLILWMCGLVTVETSSRARTDE